MDIFIKLLFIHLLGDFLLQWPAMLAGKNSQKFASPYLYLHGLIHGALSLLVVWDLSWLPAIAIITVTHIVIDGMKNVLTNEHNECRLFFADQALHLLILFGIWSYMTDAPVTIFASHPHFWPHLTFVFFVTYPASIMIQKFFSKWSLPQSTNASLRGAGVYIGFFERMLIYLSVVTLNWTLVGLLIAGKSVFRFAELNKTGERVYADYLFVGTLLSLFIGVAAGVLFLLSTGQGMKLAI